MVFVGVIVDEIARSVRRGCRCRFERAGQTGRSFEPVGRVWIAFSLQKRLKTVTRYRSYARPRQLEVQHGTGFVSR